MKKILVTGGLGYIGSHTVVVLQEAGYQVIIIDDLSKSNKNVLQSIFKITGKMPVFFEVDLKDSSKLNSFLAKINIDGVIHLAGYKFVGESVERPLVYYQNNVVGLLNLLDSIDKYNINHFIFSSSCTVYGQADAMPINEYTSLKQPESPYGKTKAMGEQIIEDFVFSSDLNAIALRYFNPIGSHDSGLIGDLQIPPNNLIPFITEVVSGKNEFLNVFGDDYDTRDGTAVRDYVDVNDIAKAHLLALEYLFSNKNENNFEVFNLGSGKGTTVLEIINAFEKANDLKVPFKVQSRRSGDIKEAYADFSKAKQKLNWEPVTPLESSMKTAWEFQKQLNLKY